MRSKVCAAFMCLILVLRGFSLFACAVGEDICFYLDCQRISGNMLRVDVMVKNNTGFCGGIFSLEYNNQIVSYSHATRGENIGNMNFTPTVYDTGRINMLFDSTQNLCFDTRLCSFYFLILKDGININFKLSGAGDIFVAQIQDGGKVTGICALTEGYYITSDTDTTRILGFQRRDGDIRIVGLTKNQFENIGIYITRVDIDKGRVTSEKMYLDAYEHLNGTSMTPMAFGYDYFFAHTENIEKGIVCFYITPFCQTQDGEIIGKEKTLLFYKGEYI